MSNRSLKRFFVTHELVVPPGPSNWMVATFDGKNLALFDDKTRASNYENTLHDSLVLWDEAQRKKDNHGVVGPANPAVKESLTPQQSYDTSTTSHNRGMNVFDAIKLYQPSCNCPECVALKAFNTYADTDKARDAFEASLTGLKSDTDTDTDTDTPMPYMDPCEKYETAVDVLAGLSSQELEKQRLHEQILMMRAKRKRFTTGG